MLVSRIGINTIMLPKKKVELHCRYKKRTRVFFMPKKLTSVTAICYCVFVKHAQELLL